MSDSPRVFVSYTHDSPRHRGSVREFCDFLGEQGIEVCLDQYVEGVRQDWFAWATKNIVAADFVIVIASPHYRRAGDGGVPSAPNRGIQAEASILRDLLQEDRELWTRRLLPVVLPGREVTEIPRFLQPWNADHYIVSEFTAEGAASLLTTLGAAPAPAEQGPDAPPTTPPGDTPAGSWVQHATATNGGFTFAVQNGTQNVHGPGK